MSNRPDYLAMGEPARLIPTVADSAKEQKITSVLLAGMRSVYEFRQALLKSIGRRVGTTAKLEAWTEVTFESDKKDNKSTNDRPDGLLVLKTGRREWRALIEAKVGNEEVGEDQIERYLQQAKKHGIDAVITITNQFSALPTHHPVQLSKKIPKNVELFHWSWSFIFTQCALLLKNDDIEDEDQVFILNELKRYFESDKSGISAFNQMNEEWKEVVNKVKSNGSLSKTSEDVQNTITAWHQEQRDLCLIMSRLTGSDVTLKLKNSHRTDPTKRLKDEVDEFCKTYLLVCSISIPNAAAEMGVCADIQRRMITCSMQLTAPKDKKSTKARANWLIRQLKNTSPEGFLIKAIRPGKAESTQASLETLKEDPQALESEQSNAVASTLEIVYQVDLAGKFSGRKVFVDELEKAVPHFYQAAGQGLKAWVAAAPKIAASEADQYEDASDVATGDEE